MLDKCLKCNREESNKDNSSKLEPYGEYYLCRKCYRPLFKAYFKYIEFGQKFYKEIMSRVHPERLNEKSDEEKCPVQSSTGTFKFEGP
jgi:hypothetical protein